ncbi:MAG: DUF4389 domain-containing protein [Dehalococcoidia bacterium]|nr:DUF4389 domain-containing protein [Dehalococcoidia bacterium]
MATLTAAAPDPITLEVDYAESLDRVTTLFRPLTAIPVLIVMSLVTAGSNSLSFGIALMLLFRGRYPAPWFEWMRYMNEYQTRAGAYIGLLTDEYPSTTDEQRVHLRIAPPVEASLSRWMPLVKWLLAVPHYIVLALLVIALICTTLVAWVVILIRGRYPRGLFNFAVGVNRWGLRVMAYVSILNTDRYPPFSLR